jgi:pimeloyl-ACP methyl ester carboxylesterase
MAGCSGAALSDKSGFRNAEARRRYLAVYDRLRALTPLPSATHDVETEFGVVRVYQDGPDGGVPLVLLHCFWATSAMWAEHIPALTVEFTVYTVDMLGQPGTSVQTKPMSTANHCALDERGAQRAEYRWRAPCRALVRGWTAVQTAARQCPIGWHR